MLEEQRQINYSTNKRQVIKVPETMDILDFIKIISDKEEENSFSVQ